MHMHTAHVRMACTWHAHELRDYDMHIVQYRHACTIDMHMHMNMHARTHADAATTLIMSHDKSYSNTAVPRRWTFEIVVHLSRVTR